ncbi:hypothetical protein ACWDBW_34240 [Streptomyces sp. NPDC001107]
MGAEEDPLVDVDREEEDERDAQADDRGMAAGRGGEDRGHGEPQEDVGRVLRDEHVAAEAGAVRAQPEEERRQPPEGRQGRGGDGGRQQQVGGERCREAGRRGQRERGQARQGDQGETAQPVPVGAQGARADRVAPAQRLSARAGQDEGGEQYGRIREQRRFEGGERMGLRHAARQHCRERQTRQQQHREGQRSGHRVAYGEEVVASPEEGESGYDQGRGEQEEEAGELQGEGVARPEQDQAQGQPGQEQGPGRVEARERAAQGARVDAQHGEEGADREQGRHGRREH